MRNELRRERHADQYRFASVLPISLRRYEKRRQRQYFARLAMREYRQEESAERAEWSAFLLDMDYGDAYSSEDEWQEYATEADRREAKRESEYSDYYDSDYFDYGSDYMDDWDRDYPIGCKCRYCRPDLHFNVQESPLNGYSPGARGRIVNVNDGVSLGELLRKRLQP